jgi:hypothetical protein
MEERLTIGKPDKDGFLAKLFSPQKRPIIATIVGEGGIGKTSLASYFPAPIFLRTEDGSQAIAGREDVAMFPLCKTVADVMQGLNEILSQPHPFKTLVIDSITQLSNMIESEIVAADPKAKSINQANGGYGAGYATLAAKHGEIRKLCGDINERRGMHVVFIAHAVTERVNPPDVSEYLRYSIRIHKDSIQHYSDNVDLVGFLKLKTYVTEGKASTTDERVLTCYPTPAHIGKNRFGIKQDLPFVEGQNPLGGIL